VSSATGHSLRTRLLAPLMNRAWAKPRYPSPPARLPTPVSQADNTTRSAFRVQVMTPGVVGVERESGQIETPSVRNRRPQALPSIPQQSRSHSRADLDFDSIELRTVTAGALHLLDIRQGFALFLIAAARLADRARAFADGQRVALTSRTRPKRSTPFDDRVFINRRIARKPLPPGSVKGHSFLCVSLRIPLIFRSASANLESSMLMTGNGVG
jgi:hypothetical protein